MGAECHPDLLDWRYDELARKKDFALHRISQDGHWEIRLSQDKLKHGDHYRLRIHWHGGKGDRIPAYSRRVVQDPDTLIFNAQVWSPSDPYRWKCMDFQSPSDPIFVYEVHVGMAQEEEKIGSYREFTTQILPRIAATGYNTLQLMAIQEHPYYGSFGYQVSNFFVGFVPVRNTGRAQRSYRHGSRRGSEGDHGYGPFTRGFQRGGGVEQI